MIRRGVSIAGVLLLGASLGSAQAPIEERVPITDPDQPADLGLPRDATDLDPWSRAAAAVQAPETWGTRVGQFTVLGNNLVSEHYSWLVATPLGMYCSGSEVSDLAQEGLAHLQLPEGAALLYLNFWAYDEDPVYGLTFNIYEFCQGQGFDPPTTTLLGSGETVGSGGYYEGFVGLNSHRVNNRDCGYSVRVIFIPGNATCVSDKLQLLKLQASWVRQVSPAPATASFGDVPTGHPFFQFVEALAKSGITGGCGNGNFCPEQPLTRGQMAVFLAKGLGLAWP